MPRGTCFTKQVTIIHRNTLILHLILKFAFAHVFTVSSRRLFVHKGNMYCVSGLQFSCKHNYITAILKIDYRTSQNLFDLVLEYCYGLFQTIKYFIADWKSSKYNRNIRFEQIVIVLTLLLKILEDIKTCSNRTECELKKNI